MGNARGTAGPHRRQRAVSQRHDARLIRESMSETTPSDFGRTNAPRCCPFCGSMFAPKRYNQRFCDTSHKNRWWYRHRDSGPVTPRMLREIVEEVVRTVVAQELPDMIAEFTSHKQLL